MHAIQKYEPTMDKIMRMHSVTSTIENGFAHLPDKAAWLGEYLHELTSFPLGKHDDQADSTSQALDWFKQESRTRTYGLLEYYKQEAERLKAEEASGSDLHLTNRGALLRELDGARFPAAASINQQAKDSSALSLGVRRTINPLYRIAICCMLSHLSFEPGGRFTLPTFAC